MFDLVVPAHDEEMYLEACLERLIPLVGALPVRGRITIADSGSSDRTWELASKLACHPMVRALHVPRPGRGLALRSAWSTSDAPFVGYTDVDLSGDPAALPAMLAELLEGRADIVVASRLAPGAVVERGLKREVLSRCYGELLQWLAAPPFLDAQCGLKVLRSAVLTDVLDRVEDDGWFFDTELLLLAWQSGWRIDERATAWIQRTDSRVDVLRTSVEDVRGLGRMTRARVRETRHRPPRTVSLQVRGLILTEAVDSIASAVTIGAIASASRRGRSTAAGAVLGAAVLLARWARRTGPRSGAVPILHGALVSAAAIGARAHRRVGASRSPVLWAVAPVLAALLRACSLWCWDRPSGSDATGTPDPASACTPERGR